MTLDLEGFRSGSLNEVLAGLRRKRDVGRVDIFGLYPSTIEFIKRCYNIAVRSIVAVVVWAMFALSGVFLDRVMDFSMKELELPESVQSIVSPMAYGVPIILGVAILITSVFDIFRFSVEHLRQPNNAEQDSDDGR